MPATFDWDDAEEIGIQLAEKYPDADPLSVRYTDLHKWVTGLDGFTGDPKAIQRRQARSDPDGLARGAQREKIVTREAWPVTREPRPVKTVRRKAVSRLSSFESQLMKSQIC